MKRSKAVILLTGMLAGCEQSENFHFTPTTEIHCNKPEQFSLPQCRPNGGAFLVYNPITSLARPYSSGTTSLLENTTISSARVASINRGGLGITGRGFSSASS